MSEPARRVNDLHRGTASVLGIDFGTTNTVAAWYDDGGKLHFVQPTADTNTLPSVVHFGSADQPLVGEPARLAIVEDPENAIYGFKRFLGRRYQSDYVHRNMGRYAFELCEGPEGQTATRVKGKVIPLEEVSGHVFRRVAELARAVGPDFEECVLTVPAHFTLRQRRLLREAAQGAGLEVRALVNEPTAAALYYAKSKAAVETLLVYDLGGGTFDVTLLRLRRGIAEVLGTGGDAFLGGADFDERVTNHLLEQFERTHGLDLRNDRVVLQRIAFAAERAKIELSTKERVEVRVPLVARREGKMLDLVHVLEREELEEVVAPLIERTAALCEEVAEEAGIAPDEISELVLAGGQTRMPAIRRRLEGKYRIDTSERSDPVLGIAVGAALLGQGPQLLSDVLSVPIWMMTVGAAAREIIPRNAFLPCSFGHTIRARPPEGQPLVVVIYQSLEEASVDREILGTLRVSSEWLAKTPGSLTFEVRMTQACELSFFLSADGRGRTKLHWSS